MLPHGIKGVSIDGPTGLFGDSLNYTNHNDMNSARAIAWDYVGPANSSVRRSASREATVRCLWRMNSA